MTTSDKNVLLFTGSAYIAGFALVVSSFVLSDHTMRRQLFGIGFDLASASTCLAALAFVAGIAIMGIGYIALLRWAGRVEVTMAHRRSVWLLLVALVIMFFFMPPFLSSDVMGYYQQGWLTVAKGANPNTTAPGTFGQFPGKELMNGMNYFALSPYGPVWTQLEALTFLVSWGHVWVGIMLFKLYAALATLILAFAIGKVMFRLRAGEELHAIVLVAANPLVLIEAPGMAHNDIIALALVAVGIWLQMHFGRRGWIALACAMIASLIKIVAAPAVAVMLYLTWKTRTSVSDAALNLTKAVLLGGIIGAIAASPLISEMADIPYLFGLANVYQSYEIRLTPVNLLRDALVSVLAGTTLEMDPETVKLALLAVSMSLVGVTMVILLRTKATLESIVPTMGPIYLVGTVAASYWRAWYVLWPMALTALGAGKAWRILAVVYSLLAATTYIITRHSGIFCGWW
jgi:hypothetical protein